MKYKRAEVADHHRQVEQADCAISIEVEIGTRLVGASGQTRQHHREP